MSELEETLGVDRFLDRVSEDTFAVLTDIVRESKDIIESKTRNIKESFQMHWNTKILSSMSLEKVFNSCYIDSFSDLIICTGSISAALF